MSRNVPPRRTRGGSVPRVGLVAATARIELRATPDQHAAWSAAAAAEDLPLAEWVRAACEVYALRDRDALADLGREVVALVRARVPQRRAG